MSCFQVIVPPLDQPYTYRVPGDWTEPLQIGQRVLVPLRRQSVTGFLWEPVAEGETDPQQEIKPIERILDPYPLFSESLRPFLLWTARYYHYPLGRVLKTALPPGLNFSKKNVWRITPQGIEALGPEFGLPRPGGPAPFFIGRKRRIGLPVSPAI